MSPEKQGGRPSDRALQKQVDLANEMFRNYHNALNPFPQSIVEQVTDSFASQSIFPGPTTSELMKFYQALIRKEATDLLNTKASEFLAEGTLPQLFLETLDRRALLEVSQNLIANSLSRGLWSGERHDTFILIFEEPSQLNILGATEGDDIIKYTQTEDSTFDLAHEVRTHYDTFAQECLAYGQRLRSQIMLRGSDAIVGALSEGSFFEEWINSHYERPELYLSPLTSAGIYLGTTVVFHSGSQYQGSRIGADIALVSQALALGLKQIIDLAATSTRL